MKSFSYLVFIFIVSVMMACSGNENRGSSSDGQPLPGPTAITPPTTNTNNAATTTDGNVQHYICPNNCEGSGGSVSGTCPVCGSEYAHNPAFHAQTAPTNTTTTTTDPAGTITPPAPGSNISITQDAGPATNSSGVYHYTCPSGCEGGAAGRGACASCGAELAHNPAFHQ